MRTTATLAIGVMLFGLSVCAEQESSAKPRISASSAAIGSLRGHLAMPRKDRPALEAQDFSSTPLTEKDALAARELLVQDRRAAVIESRRGEMTTKKLTLNGHTMPFSWKRFGEMPADGWSLYISLHGGGGAPPRVNDRQWENQKRLYQLKEGIYVAPRAPTDTWNLWHQSHIDPLLARLIENMVVFEQVNPNRVYIMGYSAGGDGVYQLAPRMADRFAAAAMMAGHPNETSPLGLRNLPFALQVGQRDAAYNRNKIAGQWKVQLAQLRERDPGGYEHFVKIHPNKGHWMDREDAVAIDWMATYKRNPTPDKIVWKQDDVTHAQFYWLAVDDKQAKPRAEIVAEVHGQSISLSTTDVDKLTVFVDDRFIDMDQPIRIECSGRVIHDAVVQRTIASLSETLKQRGDPHLSFSGAVTVSIPKPFPQSLIPDAEIPQYSALRCAEPPVIDGKLDEQAWTSAETTRSFVDLIGGQETIHETRAAILWDDEYMYIGFWVAEPNVDAKYKNRDDPIYYDNDVEVFIAGKDAYYEFEINAHGTVYEGMFVWQDAYDSGGYSDDPQLTSDHPKAQTFDGVEFRNHPRGKRIAFLGYDFPNFKSAVHIDGTINDPSDVDQGWTVELAFPWKEMKWLAKGDSRALPPRPGDRWRIDLFRFNKYKTAAPATDSGAAADSGAAVDSGGWAWGKHGVWDSHIPEIFPIVTFQAR